MRLVDSVQFGDIASVNIMEMNPLTALAKLCVCRRPLARLFEISFKTFVAVFIRNIKVYDNMILRNFHIMQLGRIYFRECRLDLLPFFGWRTVDI